MYIVENNLPIYLSENDTTSNPIPKLPLGKIFSDLTKSVANAQFAMDTTSLESEIRIRQNDLHKMGFSSHWYTIPELKFDMRVAFSINEGGEVKIEFVDADYQSKYGFNLEGSSTLKTKIVSKPPTDIKGMSILDSDLVIKHVGQIEEILEVYDLAQNPQISVNYQPINPQGYDGGFWHVGIIDHLEDGTKQLVAHVLFDDYTCKVIWLWTLPVK